jgi:hypothetical protein
MRCAMAEPAGYQFFKNLLRECNGLRSACSEVSAVSTPTYIRVAPFHPEGLG